MNLIYIQSTNQTIETINQPISAIEVNWSLNFSTNQLKHPASFNQVYFRGCVAPCSCCRGCTTPRRPCPSPWLWVHLSTSPWTALESRCRIAFPIVSSIFDLKATLGGHGEFYGDLWEDHIEQLPPWTEIWPRKGFSTAPIFQKRVVFLGHDNCKNVVFFYCKWIDIWKIQQSKYIDYYKV